MGERQVITCSFGSALHELIRHSGIEGYHTRDDLRRLPAETVRQFGQQVLENITHCQDTTLLNTHVTYREGELLVVDPSADLRLRARDYIFVRADPATIAARREQDRSRNRAPETKEMIAIHQTIALAAVQAIVDATAARLTILDNSPENIGRNIATIRRILWEGCAVDPSEKHGGSSTNDDATLLLPDALLE